MGYSVIVTAYNEEDLLPRCLESINNQTVKPTLKIMIDDVSTDRTPDIGREHGFHVYSISPPKKEKGYENRYRAFYTGITTLYAQGGPGDFILKVDSDTIIPKNYAEKLLNCMSNPKIGVCSGVSNIYANKRFISNGAIMYRVIHPIPYLPVKYGWDRQIATNIMKKGYDFQVIPDLIYTELRPPRIKKPPLWRVLSNRLELKYLALRNSLKP